MEDVDNNPEEVTDSILSENGETNSRVTTQEADADPGVEYNEQALESLSQEQVFLERITNLQKHMTLVSDIQTAADTRESMRRKELEEARKIRLEWLENDVKSCRERFEEIIRGWSIAKAKVIPQELREALNSQQKLCAPVIKDKKKLINDLLQELKVGDDRFVKDLREQAEELDLIMKKMEEQIKCLSKTYREELNHAEEVHQQESTVILTKDKREWEQHMKDLKERELARQVQRKKKIVEGEVKIHNLMLELPNMVNIDHNAHLQLLEREHQKIQTTNMISKLKIIKQKHDVEAHKVNHANMNSRIIGLQAQKKILVTQYTSQVKQISTMSQYLTNSYKNNIHKYGRIHKKIKHFSVADGQKFEEMWLTIEAEVMELVERALEMDMLICTQHFGMDQGIDVSCPIESERQTPQDIYQPFQTDMASCCSQGMMDTSDGPRSESSAESADTELCNQWTAMQSENNVEEEKLSVATPIKMLELLCDEACFLIENNLKVLAPLENEEKTAMKIGSLLLSFGIEEQDFPKLANFFLNYKHQLSEQTEDVSWESGGSRDQAEAIETSSTSKPTSDLIPPNYVLSAFKSFLKQYMPLRESSGHQKFSGLHVEERDSSEDKEYWVNMGNIIDEYKVKLWEATESTLRQYLVVLTEISELVPESEMLRQQNTELQRLLELSHGED